MKKLSVIAGMILTLVGCGSDKSSENSKATAATPTETSVAVDAATQSPETSEEPTTELLSSNAVFIECKYSDRSIVNYKIENNTIYAFTEVDNAYVDDVVYAPGFDGKYIWTGPEQTLNTRISFQESDDSFDIDVFLGRSGSDAKVRRIRVSINRKTGTVSSTPYWIGDDSLVPTSSKIIAKCTPSANMVIEQNSF